jgi:TetR/AcrR family transcriptional regulator, lmrAB and yxaGH operons repressor
MTARSQRAITLSCMPARRDTRDRMLDTAYGLFRRRGYSQTSLRTLVDEGGLPRGSVYFHFPGGKDELALEVVQLSARRAVAAMEDIAASTHSPDAFIHAVFASFVVALEGSDYTDGCPLAALVLEVLPGHATLEPAAREVFEAWEGSIAAGLAAHDIDPARAHELATLTTAGIEGGLILARVRRDPEPLRLMAREVGELARAAWPAAARRRARARARSQTSP